MGAQYAWILGASMVLEITIITRRTPTLLAIQAPTSFREKNNDIISGAHFALNSGGHKLLEKDDVTMPDAHCRSRRPISSFFNIQHSFCLLK